MSRVSAYFNRTPEEVARDDALHREIQANIDASHSAHVMTAWDAIATRLQIPYMCGYAVAAGAATSFMISALNVVRQQSKE